MLGKLIKHELKATSRLLIPLYLVLLCISIINRILYQSGINDGILGFFTGFLMITQIVLIIAIFVTTVLFMIIRFYKNLLSDEGYLMFTLPVNTHQLIISKLLVTIFWLIVSIIVVLTSLYIVFATSGSMSFIISEFQKAIIELNTQFGVNGRLIFSGMILLILISIVSYILLFYTSIAIGQLFSKHKIIASFVAYAVLYNAIQLLMVAVLVLLSYALSGNPNFTTLIPQIIFPVGIVISLLICVVFYVTTNFIFRKKLNID